MAWNDLVDNKTVTFTEFNDSGFRQPVEDTSPYPDSLKCVDKLEICYYNITEKSISKFPDNQLVPRFSNGVTNYNKAMIFEADGSYRYQYNLTTPTVGNTLRSYPLFHYYTEIFGAGHPSTGAIYLFKLYIGDVISFFIRPSLDQVSSGDLSWGNLTTLGTTYDSFNYVFSYTCTQDYNSISDFYDAVVKVDPSWINFKATYLEAGLVFSTNKTTTIIRPNRDGTAAIRIGLKTYFTMSSPPPPYFPVTIGTQTWDSVNLGLITYNDGTTIPNVTDGPTWAALTTGAYTIYANNTSNSAVADTYGVLYNWYAVMGIWNEESKTDVTKRKQLAPVGWHIPSLTEWNTLVTYLGTTPGGKLKEIGTTHWTSPNTGATNSVGFSALPGGFRSFGGTSSSKNTQGTWWSSTEYNTTDAWNTNTYYNASFVDNLFINKAAGYSVRLIKDTGTTTTTTTALTTTTSTTQCPDISVAGQLFTSCNLDVDKYRNGDPIPQITDPWVWQSLTTGAWCWFNNNPNNSQYGKIYNWYAVTDSRGLGPVGYRVPSSADWQNIISFGSQINLQEGGYRIAPNSNIIMSSFGGPVSYIQYWSTTASTSFPNTFSGVIYNYTSIDNNTRQTGYPVRLMRDISANDIFINGEVWAGSNTSITTYRDGTAIPQVTINASWAALTTGAWCYYANTSANGTTYGKLYNWYAVAGIWNEASKTDPLQRKVFAPIGYHVPTDVEWDNLTSYLGGDVIAGGKMKETGTSHWTSPNLASNSSFFTALPGGYRDELGTFAQKNYYCDMWASTEFNTLDAWAIELYNLNELAIVDGATKKVGMSVRFKKD